MSKFFNTTQKESLQVEANIPVAVPEVDVFLAELQESADSQLPTVQAPDHSFEVSEVLEDFENDRASKRKIRPGTGEYRNVKLRQSSKVLAADPSLADARSDSYRRIRTRLMQQRSSEGFRVLAVTSPVQGEGKTLTAINLALCCAQLADFKVLLVDADLRTCGCSGVLGIDSGAGLAEVLTSAAVCSEAVAQTDQPNLYVLSAGTAKLAPSELFADSAWREFANWASRQFDLVIVDAPPVLPVPDFELIGAVCDRIVVVARPFVTRNGQLEHTLARIKRAKFAGLVMNGSDLNTREYCYEYANRSQSK